MVGSAVVRLLERLGVDNTLCRSSSELDLRDQAATLKFFKDHKPGTVIFAAATVGGIHANSTFPASFIYDNLIMSANAIDSAFRAGTKRF